MKKTSIRPHTYTCRTIAGSLSFGPRTLTESARKEAQEKQQVLDRIEKFRAEKQHEWRK